MKLLLQPILAALVMPTPINTKDTCNFFMEYYPEVIIEDTNQLTAEYEFGKLKYKKESLLDFLKRLNNVYNCQYFSFRKLKKNSKGNRALIPSNIHKKDREA